MLHSCRDLPVDSVADAWMALRAISRPNDTCDATQRKRYVEVKSTVRHCGGQGVREESGASSDIFRVTFQDGASDDEG